jgi:hypothetical protein
MATKAFGSIWKLISFTTTSGRPPERKLLVSDSARIIREQGLGSRGTNSELDHSELNAEI